MKSFAYSEDDFDSSLCYQIWYEVERLRMYFYKFCDSNADEAMQLVLMHAMSHYNPNKGDLIPYIKTLAREITKDNGRTVACDFLEQTVTENSDERGIKNNLGEVADISDEVVEQIILSSSRREEIAELALQFMNFFMLLCQSLINRDTSTVYFPDIFISECLSLSKKSRNFNQECLSLYSEFKDEFDKFLNYGVSDIGTWRETDCDLIAKNGSKRIKIVNMDGSLCKDPDAVDKWSISGNLNGKHIVKVSYYEQWDKMCDMIDEDGINAMKFTIDYSYIIRTLGGSLSVINPSLFNEYELCKMEILTNLLYDTGGRYLSVGSKCMYFLVDISQKQPCIKIPNRIIKGVQLNFEAIDVTP